MSERVYNVLFLCTGKRRITLSASLPLAGIDKMALGTKLREIGRGEGSTFDRSKAG